MAASPMNPNCGNCSHSLIVDGLDRDLALIRHTEFGVLLIVLCNCARAFFEIETLAAGAALDAPGI
jgi:hypothetical protein